MNTYYPQTFYKMTQYCGRLKYKLFVENKQLLLSIVCLIQNVNMWIKQQIHNDVSIQLV